MGRNPIKNCVSRLITVNGRNSSGARYVAWKQRIVAPALFVFCTAAVLMAGCSKFGSRNALSRQSLPFTDTVAPQQNARRAPNGQKNIVQNAAPRAPRNPVRSEIKTVSKRPPKLSQFPNLTLYAEPAVSAVSQANTLEVNASQVSFEQDIQQNTDSPATQVAKKALQAFDPTAEPPAEIFSQLVAEEETNALSQRPLAPMLFEQDSRRRTPNFNRTLRDESVVEVNSPPAATSVSETVRTPDVTPLLVVGDDSAAESTVSHSKNVAAVEFEIRNESATEVRNEPAADARNEPEFETANNITVATTLQEASQVDLALAIANLDSTVNDERVAKEGPMTDPGAFAQPPQWESNTWQTYEVDNNRPTDLVADDYRAEIDETNGQPSANGGESPIVDADLANGNSVNGNNVNDNGFSQTVESDFNNRGATPGDEILIDTEFAPQANFLAAPEFDEIPELVGVGSAVLVPTLDSTSEVTSISPQPTEPPALPPAPDIVLAAVSIAAPKMPVSEAITTDDELTDDDFNAIARLDRPSPQDEPEFSGSVPDFEFSGNLPNFEPQRAPQVAVAERSFESSPVASTPAQSMDFSPLELPTFDGNFDTGGVPSSFDTSDNHFRKVSFESYPEQTEPSAATEIPAVGVEELMKLNAVTWKSRLAETVALVNEQLASENTDSETRTSLEVNLRLLDVLSRQMNGIVDNQQNFSESENQYWQSQLEAITAMLTTADPDNDRANEMLKYHSAHATLNHLRSAVSHLESLANLRVVSGAFCTEVSGYGQFQPFQQYAFPSGQRVLVYCEIENFTSVEEFNESLDQQSSGASFRTRLRGSYAVYDSSGHAVQQAEFPVLEDVARKRRRDFYMHLPITIGELVDGDYEMHLLVEDLSGNKTASLTPPLKFTVVAPPMDRQARRP